MSGIGPAMDMAGELARDAAVRPHPVPASQGGSDNDPVATEAAPAVAAARAEAAMPDANPVSVAVDDRGAPTVGTRSAAGSPDQAAAEAPGSSAVALPADPAPAASAGATTTAPVAGESALLAPAPAAKLATTQAPTRPAQAASPADAGSLGSTVFALLLVVGLILALGWLAKRMPGFGRGTSGNGLRVVASLPIGPRERVVVVEVGQTQLLLGVGPGGTRTLHTLAEPLPEAGAGPAPQFAQVLAQHFGKKA